QSQLRYNIIDKRLNLPSGMGQLTLQELRNTRPDSILPNYAKLGIGNFNSTLVEVYINSGTDDHYQRGFYAKHLNQKGDLENQRFSEQNLGVFGRSVLEKFTLTGEVGFNRYSTAFYGLVPPGAEQFNYSAEDQHFNDFYITGE